MSYKNILFSLLFIFLTFGFLFFNADFASGADGVCNCDIVHTDTGDTDYTKDVPSKSEETCVEEKLPDENLFYQNCEWQYTGGICDCVVQYEDGQKGNEKHDNIKTKEECDGLVTQKSEAGQIIVESCKWTGGKALQPIVTEGGTPSLDIPSVAGLDQLKNNDVKVIFGNIIKVGTGLIGSIALALFAYAGVLWMLSGGNAEKATKARNILIWATMGLFVILASYTIVSFIFSAVG
ncbi:MAG: hypothetical protein HY980_01830 [Candidatus Magasanikbacteria bacterium]|nr:hypothetical protein [Candidatus Magasanikbacteria bacterium]